MQQEHSCPIVWRFSLLLSLQSLQAPPCRVDRHSASLAAEYPPKHQHLQGRTALLRSRGSGEAAKMIPSRADIISAAAL